MRRAWLTAALTAGVLTFGATASYAVSIGLTDTFTTNEQNWFAGGLGPPGSIPPIPPDQQPSGGPGGAGDGFLQITGVGGAGAGSRIVAINTSQWTGNYLTAGVNAIAMDLQNQGSSDLTIRLLFENPFPGPPTDEAVTSFGAFLPAHSTWMHFLFPVGPGALVPQGTSDVNTLLSNVTLLRIIHSVAADEADTVIGQLGVDNITATASATAVPEPATLVLTIAGIGAAVQRRRQRR